MSKSREDKKNELLEREIMERLAAKDMDDWKRIDEKYKKVDKKDVALKLLDSMDKKLDVLKTQLNTLPDSTKKENLNIEWDRISKDVNTISEYLKKIPVLPKKEKQGIQQLESYVSRLDQFINKEVAQHHKIAEQPKQTPAGKQRR